LAAASSAEKSNPKAVDFSEEIEALACIFLSGLCLVSPMPKPLTWRPQNGLEIVFNGSAGPNESFIVLLGWAEH
jgi:hypothetical protein